MGAVLVGTSGWSYDEWAGRFYPEGLGRAHWLSFYTERFPTVEVNYSFYRLPSETTVARWAGQAPSGFRWALKGSRVVTHMKRLRDVEAQVTRFCDRVRALHASTAAILWQLPPGLTRDDDLLTAFLELLPNDLPHAVEFRHRSWLDDTVAESLSARGVAGVGVSSTTMPSTLPITARHVYVRFHGLEGGFRHDYTDVELAPWVLSCQDAAAAGHSVYAYFNNDGDANAPANARRFAMLVGEA